MIAGSLLNGPWRLATACPSWFTNAYRIEMRGDAEESQIWRMMASDSDRYAVDGGV
jgi:hypothetical protein